MQILKLSNLRNENLIFHECKEYSVKNSQLKYQRIKVETNYPTNIKGPLVIETPFLFIFGKK